MINIFSGNLYRDLGKTSPASFLQVKEKYIYELNKLTEYYHNTNFAVKTNHLVCRIIKTIEPSITLPIDSYISYAKDRIDRVSNHFRITSSTVLGEVKKNVFYGENDIEFIIEDDEDINPYLVSTDWENYTPITVMFSKKTDVGMMLPKGNADAEPGVVIITINYLTLIMQYREFMLSQIDREYVFGHEYFVHRYVITNMLPSQLDMAVYNRHIAIATSGELMEYKRHHPISISNYNDKLDDNIRKQLSYISRKKLDGVNLLNNMLAITTDSMLHSISLREFNMTRRSSWLVMYSRLGVMLELIRLGGDSLKKLDRTNINNLIITISRLESMNAFDSLPENLKIMNDIDVYEVSLL